MNPHLITIGGVGVLYGSYDDWSYPQFGTLVDVLSDGSSVDNQVLQSSAVPRRRATVTGWLQSQADVDALDAYTASKEIVPFDDDGLTRDVVVMDFSHPRVQPGLWSCTVALADFGATGS